VRQAPETEADFERMSWPDCRIWKIEIAAGLVEGQADLVLGLDLVVDVLCGVAGGADHQRDELSDRRAAPPDVGLGPLSTHQGSP
jgi:hypothetical protein